jgi:protein-tyrosine phosphatase
MAFLMVFDGEVLAQAFPNLREVRGLAAQDGRILRSGMIYRSEAIVAPDDRCRARLREMDIATVFDLRGPQERERAPNDWWRDEGVRIEEADLVADARNAGTHWQGFLADPDGVGAESLMLSTYRTLPGTAIAHLGRIFDAILTGRQPILIHCTAGKDRTGVVIALLLRAAGIVPEAIMADYLESGRRENRAVTADTLALLSGRLGREPAPHAVMALTGVDPRYLLASFDVIEAEYGGMASYFEKAGWSAERLQRLRDRLLR